MKKKVICHQCKNCAIENTAVLGCADDDCKCHKNKYPKTIQGKDILGKYTKTIHENGDVFIERYFKELGISAKVQEK